jgi:NAD(P)-dependent dehydrogenase (short-subunit alcohol dehydrogenase family)
MRGLKGKVAIVTGATRDMGGTVSERLATEGVKVLCCGRDIARGEQWVARIRANGGEAQFMRVDVGIEEDVRHAVSSAIARFGRLDIVVNLAAATDVGRAGGARRVTDETNQGFLYQLNINLIGPFWFYKYAIPEMQKTGGGSFVNISSLVSAKAFPGLAAYSTSKAALDGLSRQVAVDYSDSNIRSNCIGVGAIRVAESAVVHDHPVAGPALRQAQIVNRSGTPADVASMVAFLASDESSFISGEVLPVDGGARVKHFVPDLGAIYRGPRDNP